MWKCRLRKNYDSFEQFKHYSEMYGLAQRLGFKTPEDAWSANPVIQGSVSPEDFKVVKY